MSFEITTQTPMQLDNEASFGVAVSMVNTVLADISLYNDPSSWKKVDWDNLTQLVEQAQSDDPHVLSPGQLMSSEDREEYDRIKQLLEDETTPGEPEPEPEPPKKPATVPVPPTKPPTPEPAAPPIPEAELIDSLIAQVEQLKKPGWDNFYYATRRALLDYQAGRESISVRWLKNLSNDTVGFSNYLNALSRDEIQILNNMADAVWEGNKELDPAAPLEAREISEVQSDLARYSNQEALYVVCQRINKARDVLDALQKNEAPNAGDLQWLLSFKSDVEEQAKGSSGNLLYDLFDTEDSPETMKVFYIGLLEEASQIVKNIKAASPDLPPPPPLPRTHSTELTRSSMSAEQVSQEVFERAGKRSLEEIRALIADVGTICEEERAHGRGKLRKTVPEIHEKELFRDGKIVYIPETETDGNIIWASDLHGDMASFRRIIEKEDFIRKVANGSDDVLVVLGDWIDRGVTDIELNEALLALKKLYPDNVVLIAADHETINTRIRPHQFPREVVEHYYKSNVKGFPDYREKADAAFKAIKKPSGLPESDQLFMEFFDDLLSGKNSINDLWDRVTSKYRDNNMANRVFYALEDAYGDFFSSFDEIEELFNDRYFKQLPKMVVTANGTVGVHGGPTMGNVNLEHLRDHPDLFDLEATWGDVMPNQQKFDELYKQKVVLRKSLKAYLSSQQTGRFEYVYYDPSQGVEVTKDYSEQYIDKVLKKLEDVFEGFAVDPLRMNGNLMEAVQSDMMYVYNEQGLRVFLDGIGAQRMIRGHQTSTQIEGGKVNPFPDLYSIHSSGLGSLESGYGIGSAPDGKAREPNPQYMVTRGKGAVGLNTSAKDVWKEPGRTGSATPVVPGVAPVTQPRLTSPDAPRKTISTKEYTLNPRQSWREQLDGLRQVADSVDRVTMTVTPELAKGFVPQLITEAMNTDTVKKYVSDIVPDLDKMQITIQDNELTIAGPSTISPNWDTIIELLEEQSRVGGFRVKTKNFPIIVAFKGARVANAHINIDIVATLRRNSSGQVVVADFTYNGQNRVADLFKPLLDGYVQRELGGEDGKGPQSIPDLVNGTDIEAGLLAALKAGGIPVDVARISIADRKMGIDLRNNTPNTNK